MKHFTKIVFLVLLNTSVVAQNLCTNGGFESYTTLPNYYGQSCYASGWYSPSGSCTLTAGWGSPDYFNSLTTGVADLPTNYFATVSPHSGNAIMGFTPYYAPTSANYREYVERQLSTAMTPGIQYSVSFWLTNGTAATHNDGIANLGVYFSTSSITQSGDGPIILTPQLERAGVFYSTSWQQVTFSYTPSQAYNFITIGNFRNDASTTVGFFGGSRGVYYFIDDIVVQAVISLPVELTEFTAEENSGVNILHWETASEQNSRYFVIERSDDGVHFDSIGVINAAGNSNSINLYNFTDSLPFDGLNYYRLKQNDADGRFEYSNIVHVKNGTELFSIQTGASGKSLTIQTTGNLRLELYSVTGAIVYSCESLNGYQEVNLSNLSDGIYFARATDGERTVSKKILLW